VVYVIDVGHTTDRLLVDYTLPGEQSVLRDRKIDNGTFSIGEEFYDSRGSAVCIATLRTELPGFLIFSSPETVWTVYGGFFFGSKAAVA